MGLVLSLFGSSFMGVSLVESWTAEFDETLGDEVHIEICLSNLSLIVDLWNHTGGHLSCLMLHSLGILMVHLLELLILNMLVYDRFVLNWLVSYLTLSLLLNNFTLTIDGFYLFSLHLNIIVGHSYACPWSFSFDG